MSEIWRAVPGFEGSYEVSDQGRVRSLARSVMCSGSIKGTYASRKPGRLLRPGRMAAGHLSVSLGKGNSRCVHKLVLLAFVGPCPPRKEARHINGDETDNRLQNLVWDTRGNNNRDKKWHKGCAQYKLSPADITEIKRGLEAGGRYLVRNLAAAFNVSESTIYCIKRGRIHVDVA